MRMYFNPDGVLMIKKHARILEKSCLEFLNAHREWVLLQYEQMRNCRMYEDRMYCFGEWRDFAYIELRDIKSLDRILGHIQQLESHCISNAQVLEILWKRAIKEGRLLYQQLLEQFYREILASYVKDRLDAFVERMGLCPKSVEFGKSYRQLGCCYAKMGKIRLSLRLSLMPKDCIDSVIIHELAHLKHHNHSKEFWEFVRRFDADPKRANAWLTTHHENLRIYHKVFKY